jgi:pepF/M3 family oligoendopeptidase
MTTTATKIPSAPTWDLESIFPGGSKSKEYQAFIDNTNKLVSDAKSMLDNLPKSLDDSSQAKWKEFILTFQKSYEHIDLVHSFATMLASQNVDDADAVSHVARSDVLLAEWQKIKAGLEPLTLKQSDDAWNKLFEDAELAPVSFYMNDIRNSAKTKMSVEKEKLALDLGVNGFHAWDRLYNKMAGDLRVDWVEHGKTESISLGQVATKFSDPDREIRRQAFERMVEAWKTRADLAAMTLNSIAGFRLALYDNRGYDTPLFETLEQARLKKETLDAMWSVVHRYSNMLEPWMKAKMKLLGIDKFRWYDEFAPCGSADKLIPYDEAADFIVKHVNDFSPHFAEFCRMAVDKRWIEAEDRGGKRAGGYCTGTGPKRESRIFMTYSGSYENLLTLAHELGHAYHSYVLKDRPYFAGEYPMTLAETASTFSEMLVTDAALAECDDRDEKLMLLDQKLQAAYVMFCDLQCRYLFDTAFHDERRKGVVGTERLCEMMIEAQKKAYGNLLDESGYHKYFWASKLHFFLTDVPFYNYPYTFGFLFAGGVYERSKSEGAAFADKYKSMLADTGSMTSEQVAQKHLGVDLTKPEFWETAVKGAMIDVGDFVKLVG